MDTYELELVQKEQFEKLNWILESYRSTSRNSKRLLECVIFVAAIALYYFFVDILGRLWGFILAIVVIGAGFYCIESLDISLKNTSIPNGKLAYHACVAMESLIKIKRGTYSEYGINFIGVSHGKHLSLYKEFVQLYPELANKDLEKLSKIRVSQSDILN